MAWKLTNFAQSTLVQALASGATTAYINTTDAAIWPVLGAGDKTKAVIFNDSYAEVVNVTARTAGTLTIERGQESTSARAWAGGTRIISTPTAEVLQTVLNTAAQVVFTGTATFLANVYTLNVGAGNPIPTLDDGDRVTFVIPTVNTGNISLIVTNGVDSSTSKPVYHQDGEALTADDFAAGWLADAVYNTALGAWLLVTETSFNIHAAALNDGYVPAVNFHPNGAPKYWNNGTSFATPASLAKTADNWFVQYDGSIGAFSVSRQTFTPGQTDVPGNPKYYLRWDHSSAGSGSTLRRLRIPIKGVHHKAGDLVIRAFYLKAEAAHNVTAKVLQDFGTGGAPSGQVECHSDVFAVTTSWQRFSVSFTMPSITGKTLGSNGDDAVFLTFDLPVNTLMTIDIACDDFRSGHVLGAFSDSFPLPWRYGGINGSYTDIADFATDLLAATPLTDLALIEALSGTGFPARTSSTPTWSIRNFAVGTGLTIANPAGVAGNPTVSLDTALTNYVADPLSIAELASITAAFGTAAFVADSGLVHLTGIETITAQKKFKQAVDANLASYENNTTTHIMIERMSSSGTLYEKTPGPSGAADATKGFGYDFTNSRWFCDVSLILNGGVLTLPNGTVGAPSMNLGDATTGFYRGAANTISTVNSGAETWRFAADLTSYSAGHIFTGAGSVSGPAYSFATDTNTGVYSIGSDNLGIALGGVLYVDFSTTRVAFSQDVVLASSAGASSVFSAGYRGCPTAAQNSAHGFVANDAGNCVYHDEVTARTYTIPANASVAFPVGTVIIIDNTGNSGAAGAITLAITSDELRRGDGVSGTGTRTIGAGQVAMIRKVASTKWVITGVFS